MLSQQVQSCTRLEGGRKERQAETRSSGRRRREEEEVVAADDEATEEEEERLVRAGECPRSMTVASSLSFVRERCDVGRGVVNGG